MGVEACSNLRSSPFSREEEEELHKDRPTSAILDKARTDAGVRGQSVEVRGDDKTFRATKEEQQTHVGVGGALSLGHAGIEAAHLAEFHAVEHFTMAGVGASMGAAAVIGGALGGFALGVHEWLEAHAKGEEQNAALTKDEMHVAMLGQLALPQGYKTEQFQARSQAGQSAQSLAMKMTGAFATIDKPLLATMQMHADRGMQAGRSFNESTLSKEAFLDANPKIKEAYAKDPAVHDGFDSMVWAKKAGKGEYQAACDRLDARDCRYQQAHLSYRL